MRPKPHHLQTDRREDTLLRRLGAAYILQRELVPESVRKVIEEQASCIMDGALINKPRDEIAEVIRKFGR